MGDGKCWKGSSVLGKSHGYCPSKVVVIGLKRRNKKSNSNCLVLVFMTNHSEDVPVGA